jgi:hypothetical protein
MDDDKTTDRPTMPGPGINDGGKTVPNSAKGALKKAKRDVAADQRKNDRPPLKPAQR